MGVSEGFGVCFTDPISGSYNQGYNRVLRYELDKKFGEGAIDKVFAESREQSEEDLHSAKRR